MSPSSPSIPSSAALNRSSPLHACVFSFVSLALPLLFAHTARADADDTFSVVPSITVMHDDNLFRLSSSADPQTFLGKPTKADDVTVSSVTLKINKPYSLQRFEFEASLIDYRYKNFSYLSYTTQPYKAAWRWSLTPVLHGNLTTDHTTSLNNFADFTGYTTRNTHTNESSRFDGVYDLSAAWHVLAGVAQNTSTDSQVTLGQGDNRIKTAEAGIRFTFPSGSSLGYVARSGRGNYFNRPDSSVTGFTDNRFDDRENELRLTWPLTGKTSIDARFSNFEREHPHVSQRNFGGNVGNLNVNWQSSGKSFLSLGLARELGSYQTANTNYTSTDRVTLTPYWQISSKTALRARYDYAQRNYLGTISTAPASTRRDTLQTAMVALEWLPLRGLLVSTSLQNERRASNLRGLDFKSNSLNLTAQMTF